MTELEEILQQLEAKLAMMAAEQFLRCTKSGMNVEAFLNLDREEQFSKRMLQLGDARRAILDILVLTPA